MLLFCGLSTIALSYLFFIIDLGLISCAICVHAVVMWMHMLATFFVDCCCLSAVCQSLLSPLCIIDRFCLTLRAICVHVVGMWMHMLSTLGWWIVVACLWFVKAGGFIRASIKGLC